MPEPPDPLTPLREGHADDASQPDWARIEQGCRVQDADCFQLLIEHTEPRLRRLLGRMCGQRDDVDELVQETYLRAWRSVRRFRGESSLSTWLVRIAINVASNWRREQRPTLSISPEHYDVPDHAGLPEDSIRAAYEQALARLAPELRSVFVLHEADGLSYQQIADVLQCPIGTVMSRLHRARQQLLADLRERLEELMP